ncbi:hypothetical protein HPC37_02830 [Pasteurellaceae bacterium 20609_3]|uniref:portal protein n=1 Tax=Spirabiliibacterium mucosae TaxID=28156 RepID=UPI001AACA758|nr:hypothetical protein [Spirabiliibacterium mucosae]MBE2897789.1 hypothetical protein [Spirabiliibacterium mucosae]
MATERTIAEDNWARYERARDMKHRQYIEQAMKNDAMYLGDQWNENDRKALESQGRPALTLNLIKGTINAALGEMAKSQADVQFKPARGANEQAAKDLNYVYQHIAQQNDLERVEQAVVADGLILDRGYFDVRIDFSENVLGDVKIVAEDPLDVIPDPMAKDADPTTWSEVFVTRFMTLEDIEAQYGADKAKQLRLSYADSMALNKDAVELAKRTYGGKSDIEQDDGATLDEKDIKRVRVIERQYYRMRKVKQFVDLVTGDVKDVPEKMMADPEKLVAMVAMDPRVQLREITKKAVRTTITAVKTVLYDDWSLYDSFTIVPYFPYFRRGNPQGMVTNLVGPQELFNKISSQELHIVNTTANSGWIIEENSLVNMTPDELAASGSKTGIVLEYKKGYEPPGKVQPNQIPTGIHNISQKAMMSIRQISGVNESIMGMDRADVSGVAITQRREAGQVQLTIPSKNANHTRRMLARKILELVQKFYTETRIFHITDYEDPEQPQVEHAINVPDEDGSIPADITKGKYDIVIGLQPSRDSVDETIFSEAISMREAGVAIPDHIVIQHSNLPKRMEIAGMVAKVQGFGELSPEEEQMQTYQMQLQLEQATKEVAKLDAEIAEYQARAALQNAKAQTLDGYTEAGAKLAELTAKREMAEDVLKARVALAQLSAQNREIQSQRQTTAKLTSEMLRQQGDYRKELVRHYHQNLPQTFKGEI